MNPYDPFNKTTFFIKPQPTDIWGLRYFPSLEPEISNDQDHPHFGWISNVEVTDGNLDVVRHVVKEMGSNLRAAMEIGVSRNGERSMSNILIKERPQGSFYLGVDIDDKSELDDPDNNTFTLQSNSHDQQRIRDYLKFAGVQQLDLLFIDGYHSVNTTVNDWMYTDLLSPNGIVILHDTNSHPGCVALYNAVNDEFFIKNRYCLENDFGIAVFRRYR